MHPWDHNENFKKGTLRKDVHLERGILYDLYMLRTEQECAFREKIHSACIYRECI